MPFFEGQPIPVSLEGTKKILFQMENCICRIYLKDNEIGTGFFCKIPFNHNLIPVLITNNHILNENNIKDNSIIKLAINNKLKEIKMDNLRRRYTNSDHDINITIIEIIPNKDEIYNYLEIDEYFINESRECIELESKKKSIFLLHYPKGELNVSYGIIKEIIDNKKICHFCNTCNGSSGGPILSLKTFKVIGIHYGGSSRHIRINYGTFIKCAIDLFNKMFRNEIDIIYKTNEEGIERIFGDKFVENNRNNIDLIINGINNNLIVRYKLQKGENKIKIIIKNKITNLEYMFYKCKSLKNIEQLNNLDTKEIKNFTRMFSDCSSLLDLKGLQDWNVSNGNNFSYMFEGCSKLSDIKSLQNWNVSNGNYFCGTFSKCTSLSDIKELQNWNVSNGLDFSRMFFNCSSLSNIKALQNWNVSNGNNFSYMFKGCSKLSDINALKNWNVSNGNGFSYMFNECLSLSDIKALQYWNVSNGNNFSYMFKGCSLLSDIKALHNWNVSNGNDFSSMFEGCSPFSDIKALLNWNLPEEQYEYMI